MLSKEKCSKDPRNKCLTPREVQSRSWASRGRVGAPAAPRLAWCSSPMFTRNAPGTCTGRLTGLGSVLTDPVNWDSRYSRFTGQVTRCRQQVLCPK